MSQIDETMNPTGPDGQLDLLVDGELNETDRREMLLQLEREPEGWRRCALAFLEAQCWKQELGVMARSADVASAEAPAATSVPATVLAARSSWRASWRQNLALALTLGACFLIALALGLTFRGSGAGGTHGPGSGEVRSATDEIPSNGAPAAPVAQPADQLTDEVLTIDAANGQTESLRIPRARHDAFDQDVAEQGPDAIPPAVQREFERMGNQVLQQREVVRVPMNNGRRLTVPVDRAEIHYVGRGSL